MPLALPRKAIEKFSKITDLDEYIREVFAQVKPEQVDVSLNRVLCAAYLTHEKSAGGIIMPTETKAEDIWQGKAALVLKVGATAFVDTPDITFKGFAVKPRDWVTFKVGHAGQIEINGYPCRIVSDHFIEMKVADPRMVTS